MIVVKLKQTLRVISEKVGHRLIPVGSIFRAENYEDFPEWLRKEIKYFKDTLACDTLLIKEMSLNVREIDSKGISIDESKAIETSKTEKVKEKVIEKVKDAPKNEQPAITLRKRKK